MNKLKNLIIALVVMTFMVITLGAKCNVSAQESSGILYDTWTFDKDSESDHFSFSGATKNSYENHTIDNVEYQCINFNAKAKLLTIKGKNLTMVKIYLFNNNEGTTRYFTIEGSHYCVVYGDNIIEHTLSNKTDSFEVKVNNCNNISWAKIEVFCSSLDDIVTTTTLPEISDLGWQLADDGDKFRVVLKLTNLVDLNSIPYIEFIFTLTDVNGKVKTCILKVTNVYETILDANGEIDANFQKATNTYYAAVILSNLVKGKVDRTGTIVRCSTKIVFADTTIAPLTKSLESGYTITKHITLNN